MKRIFSIFLALLLAVTAIPLTGIEAEAFLNEVGAKYEIIYSAGRGKGTARSSGLTDIDSDTVLASPIVLGFTYTGYEFAGWSIGGVIYDEDDVYEFDKSDASLDYETSQYKVAAIATWSKDGTSTESGKGITGTFTPGEGEGRKFKETYTAPVDGHPGYYVVTFPEAPSSFEHENENYEFAGWIISGDTTVYEAGEQIGTNANFTAVAQWKKSSIIIGSSVKSIDVLYKPDKVKYKVGEALDLEGLVIRVTKSDDSKFDTDTGFTTSIKDGTKFEKTGDYTITVTYKEKTATFKVSVVSAESSSSSSSSKPSSSSTSSSKPSSSASSSSAPSSSEPSSSVPESSSAPESSVPDIPEEEVFEPISLAFSIAGDIPVTKIEFLLEEEIGENPQLSVAALDGYSITDAAAAKFIADGDALAAFDLSLLVGGAPYNGKSLGKVNYSLNGTQANASSNYDAYVLAMVHTVGADKFEGKYYVCDKEGTYLYDTETAFKSAVENVVLTEEDDVNRLVIIDPTGLSSFAYQATDGVIVEVQLVASRSAETASIAVSSLSPVLLVQLEVGEAKTAGGGIPLWVWIVIAAIVLIFAVFVILFLVNRSNERKHNEARYGTGSSHKSVSSGITGFDDEE